MKIYAAINSLSCTTKLMQTSPSTRSPGALKQNSCYYRRLSGRWVCAWKGQLAHDGNSEHVDSSGALCYDVTQSVCLERSTSDTPRCSSGCTSVPGRCSHMSTVTVATGPRPPAKWTGAGSRVPPWVTLTGTDFTQQSRQSVYNKAKSITQYHKLQSLVLSCIRQRPYGRETL
jgi:hypothetical protein